MEEGEREKLEHFGWTRLTTKSVKIEDIDIVTLLGKVLGINLLFLKNNVEIILIHCINVFPDDV